MKRALIASTTVVVLVFALSAPARGSHLPGTPQAERAAAPPTDCVAPVGYHRDADLPGYAVPAAPTGRVCVPFTWIDPAPAGYRGDYRVREFSFAASRRQLDRCEAAPPCGALSDVAGY